MKHKLSAYVAVVIYISLRQQGHYSVYYVEKGTSNIFIPHPEMTAKTRVQFKQNVLKSCCKSTLTLKTLCFSMKNYWKITILFKEKFLKITRLVLILPLSRGNHIFALFLYWIYQWVQNLTWMPNNITYLKYVKEILLRSILPSLFFLFYTNPRWKNSLKGITSKAMMYFWVDQKSCVSGIAFLYPGKPQADNKR